MSRIAKKFCRLAVLGAVTFGFSGCLGGDVGRFYMYSTGSYLVNEFVFDGGAPGVSLFLGSGLLNG